MFKDRCDAGKQLTDKLRDYEDCKDCIVFAIPRGGVAVAAEVAVGLSLPLDMIITKKIGAPFNPELAIGSVDPSGKASMDESAKEMFNISPGYWQNAVEAITAKIKDQLEMYRGSSVYPDLAETRAIIVDDGIATGQTVIAAIGFLRSLNAKRIIVATPVIAPTTLAKLNRLADDVKYILSEEHFFAVGQFYQDFSPVDNDEVVGILRRLKKRDCK